MSLRAKDLPGLELISHDLMLADQKNPDNGQLARVKVLRDSKTQKAYQVDLRNHRYREATHVLGDYGDWKPLLD